MNWSFLESLPGLTAVPAIWRKHLAGDFEAFKFLCLQLGDEPALSLPCSLGTSCSYHIIPVAEQSSGLRHQLFHGLCQRSTQHPESGTWPPTCPPIQLTLADITPLELSWTRLARSISKAFGLNSKFSALSIPHTVQVGTWSADAVPVILTIQTERHHFRQVVCELIARLRQRFILFAPTSEFFDALCQELILAANAGLFSLDIALTLTQSGTLLATKTPGELFAKFVPEEKLPEDAALRAFAVLKSMDTDQPMRKAPVFTVFRLYCMENLSAEQVAKRLHCSKATILNRTAIIREKTGTDPENLRAYSAQFTRIEQSLSDSRAHRTRSQSAAEDSEPSTEE